MQKLTISFENLAGTVYERGAEASPVREQRRVPGRGPDCAGPRGRDRDPERRAQGTAVPASARQSGRLPMDPRVQHQSARLQPEQHVQEDGQDREPDIARHRGHRRKRE